MFKRNKIKGLVLVGLFSLSTTFAATNANAFLLNWGIDPDGGGDSIVNVPEYLDITGTATILNDFTTFTFSETGEFYSLSVGPPTDPFSPDFPTLYASFNATGTLGATTFSFDNVVNSLEIFEEDQLTSIAMFDLLGGGGELDSSFGPAPNGIITANFQATSLATGYWFDPDGNDLSGNLLATPPVITLGFATTNASIVEGTEVFDELDRLVEFDVGNNGQFRLAEVPEPTTFMLFGAGLLGLAGLGRRRKK